MVKDVLRGLARQSPNFKFKFRFLNNILFQEFRTFCKRAKMFKMTFCTQCPLVSSFVIRLLLNMKQFLQSE